VPGRRYGTIPGYCDSTLNYTVVSRSTDGGATWSAPVETPLHVAARAHLQVDLKTGKLYALGGQDFLLPGAISVSSDQGRTWKTPVVAVPDAPACTPLPLPGAGCGPDPFLAAYGGIVATTEEGPTRVLFNSSRNDGSTFTAYPVTDSAGTPVPSSDVSSAEFPYSEPLIAADPSRPGRFAILIPRGDPNAFQVYVTDDAGRTWQGPAVIPAPLAFMPAMAFSA
jgi:BNR/Asp-box repeat